VCATSIPCRRISGTQHGVRRHSQGAASAAVAAVAGVQLQPAACGSALGWLASLPASDHQLLLELHLPPRRLVVLQLLVLPLHGHSSGGSCRASSIIPRAVLCPVLLQQGHQRVCKAARTCHGRPQHALLLLCLTLAILLQHLRARLLRQLQLLALVAAAALLLQGVAADELNALLQQVALLHQLLDERLLAHTVARRLLLRLHACKGHQHASQ
jgi:hypothetical protein